MLWDFNQILVLLYNFLTCLPLHIRHTVSLLLGLEGRESAHHEQGTECALPHLRLWLVQPLSVCSTFCWGHIPVSAGGIFSSVTAQLTSVREVPRFSLSQRDWLDPNLPLKKHLKNTGIGNIVERSFKFLLLENVKENIQLISSYSLKLVSFSCLAFPSAIYGYSRTWWADGTSTSFRRCLCEGGRLLCSLKMQGGASR